MTGALEGAAWAERLRAEAERTARAMEALDRPSLGFRAAPGQRSLGEMAWHIVQAAGAIAARTGVQAAGPAKGDPVPAEPADIARAHREAAGRIAGEVSSWTGAKLDGKVDVYGEAWSRRETLRVLLDHEIHHRGGLVVLMRQAGLPPPSLYGPAGPPPERRSPAGGDSAATA